MTLLLILNMLKCKLQSKRKNAIWDNLGNWLAQKIAYLPKVAIKTLQKDVSYA